MPLTVNTVKEIMTPDPVSVDPTSTLRDAVTTMHRYDVRHLPVTAGKQLMGIVSDRDIRIFMNERDGTVFETKSDNDKLDTIIVEDLMARSPLTVNPSTSLLETIDLLLTEKVGAVPVVADSDNGSLVGIVSYLDLLAYMRDLIVNMD